MKKSKQKGEKCPFFQNPKCALVPNTECDLDGEEFETCTDFALWRAKHAQKVSTV